jgi:hypothetical protein
MLPRISNLFISGIFLIQTIFQLIYKKKKLINLIILVIIYKRRIMINYAFYSNQTVKI